MRPGAPVSRRPDPGDWLVTAPATHPVVAVGAIVFDDAGRVLLIQRGKPPAENSWTIPGGRVELGETLRDACVREFREETGLDIDVGPVAEVVDRVTRSGDHIAFHHVIIDFLARVTGGQMQPGTDARDVRWFEPDELADLQVTEGLLPVLRRARARALASDIAAR